MSLLRGLPLSRKILLGFVPLFVLFVAVSVALQNFFQEREMMEQAQAAAHTYADLIRESLVSMMIINQEVDPEFLERVRGLEGIDSVQIVVNPLRLRGDLLEPGRAESLAVKHARMQPADAPEREALAGGTATFRRDGDRFRAVIPFNATGACRKCHAVPEGYTLGAADLHVSLASVGEASTANWRRSLLIFLAFTALAIGIASVLFARLVAEPIARLVAAAREIRRGKLDGVPAAPATAPERTRDELAFLGRQFDDMRLALREKIGQLDLANRDLFQRNAEVEDALARLRAAQEELVRAERLAVTGRLTAQLSHEINNPIHNIHSLLESALRKLEGPAGVRELIGVALEEVRRMAALTRQMLDYYRGSVVEQEMRPVDLPGLLAGVVRAHEESLSASGVNVHLDIPADIPPVRGNADKLRQVFLNLLLNARDAMPRGGTVSLTARAVPGGVRTDVQDTGAGIPPEYLGRVFDAFFTTKKEVSGVGLGLFVSYGVVRAHGGTIDVRSTVGRGSTFSVFLPT